MGARQCCCETVLTPPLPCGWCVIRVVAVWERVTSFAAYRELHLCTRVVSGIRESVSLVKATVPSIVAVVLVGRVCLQEEEEKEGAGDTGFRCRK